MIGFDQRDKIKHTRKDLKYAIQQAEEYIENCSHSIGPRSDSGDNNTPAYHVVTKGSKNKSISSNKATKVVHKSNSSANQK